jgi:hypothetical protein
LAADDQFTDAGMAADAIHSACQGGPGWYVGTACAPRHRLERLHNVCLESRGHFIAKCTSAGVALAAARLLRVEHGYIGGPVSVGADCIFVYAYAITDATRQIL